MADERFLSRWSRLKADARASAAAAPVPAAETAESQAPAAPAPTLEDAARLERDSDYSAFVARGVDAGVRRLALRRMFADPHFNVLDGLDVYMGDYTRPDPIAPAMLAALRHAHNALGRDIEPEDAPVEGAPTAAKDDTTDEH